MAFAAVEHKRPAAAFLFISRLHAVVAVVLGDVTAYDFLSEPVYEVVQMEFVVIVFMVMRHASEGFL